MTTSHQYGNTPGPLWDGVALGRAARGREEAHPTIDSERQQTGKPLEGGVRGRMERAFGRSFDEVRVHTDSAAEAASSRYVARALTLGNDIAFASGEYRPGTAYGDAIIAHELAHVAQQASATGVEQSAGYGAREDDANRGAFSALMRLWGGLTGATTWAPAQRSGLALQRCDKPTSAPTVPRTEKTPFGSFQIHADDAVGPFLPNDISQAEFERLKRAWTMVNDGTGGIHINGADADKARLIEMFGLEMARSVTFRNQILEIVEDTANPIVINVGRNNAFWVDSFATNAVDLTDLEWFEEDAPASAPWASTRGELIIHWMVERRYTAVHGGGFAPAHQHPLRAGGEQEQYRRDRGQAGRITSQTRVGPAGGVHEGVYTDDAGNRMIIRRDGSAGDPIPYETAYQANGAAAAVVQRVNNMVAEVRVRAASPGDPVPPPAELYVEFESGAGAAAAAPVEVAGGGDARFEVPLGRIVPVGGPITVRLYRQTAGGAATLLWSQPWAHPFSRMSALHGAGVVAYDLVVQLEPR